MKLYNLLKYYAYADHANDMIQDYWFRWYKKQHNIPEGDYSAIRDRFTFEVDVKHKLVICYSEDKRYEMPLEQIVHDLEKQPEIILTARWNFYDGPISGLGTYDGQMMYYNSIDDDDFNYREYTAYAITKMDLMLYNVAIRLFMLPNSIFNWVFHKRAYYGRTQWATRWFLLRNPIGVFDYHQIAKRTW